MGEKIITNPNGVIWQLAVEILGNTTFPKGVKNPLRREVMRKDALYKIAIALV